MDRSSLFPDITTLSDQALRDWALARGLLLRNLFAALHLRGQLASGLVRRAEAGAVDAGPYPWCEVLHATWVLTENLLAAFELLADPDAFDPRLASRRQAAWTRLYDRGGRKRAKFIKKSWGYPLINTPALDALYIARGLTVERGRTAMAGLATRSATYLERVLTELQAFHQKYEDICTAFKHGRAVFNLAAEIQREPNGDLVHINMNRDDDALTAILSEGDAVRIVELRVDEPLKTEICATLETVCGLVEKQFARCAELVTLVEAYIANREGDPHRPLGVMTAMFVFAEPETNDERQLFQQGSEDVEQTDV